MAQAKNKKNSLLGDETVAVNRRGRFNYEIDETMEAGLVLTGTEVKSARSGHVQINEAYASVERGHKANPEVWVHGMHIAPYAEGSMFNTDARRKRKLLLHRREIDKLIGRTQQKGYTLVPLKFYFTRGRAKLEIGVGRGRKTHDKRHAIADREIKRQISRES